LRSLVSSVLNGENKKTVSLSMVPTRPLADGEVRRNCGSGDVPAMIQLALLSLTCFRPPVSQIVSYTCSASTEAHKLSGALANRLRENDKSAEVKCIGANAVLRAATAAALAASAAECTVGIFASFVNEARENGEGQVSVLVLKVKRIPEPLETE
jgi:stage V sporulation protein SpoVS